MLLGLDVGNTNITVGVFDREDLLDSFRITTKMQRTSDEFGALMCDMLSHKGINIAGIDAAIIGSVVPDIMHSLNNAIRKYFHVTPVIIGPGVKTGINLSRLNPREVGADRIVDIVAAYSIYGGPTIVIDYGTATTYDLVTEDGVFFGGATSPGIRTAANALWQGAARLPQIEIKKMDSILGIETISSMQAGLFYGVVGETKYIIECIKKEYGRDDIKVVATGGLGRILSKEVEEIDFYDDKLTLKGLRIIYEKQK
ncbi:MAG: type III pantothenate kinase [Anaerostipes sp.]|jgi:type III pantothenate kinase|nr:type III pantothenate kinase [Anaerostipes sp.]MDD3747205.1 type III pantothenate kinase [Anaerostipes sp.]